MDHFCDAGKNGKFESPVKNNNNTLVSMTTVTSSLAIIWAMKPAEYFMGWNSVAAAALLWP